MIEEYLCRYILYCWENVNDSGYEYKWYKGEDGVSDEMNDRIMRWFGRVKRREWTDGEMEIK